MDRKEEACARLCLLTHAAWEEDMPSPLTRREVRSLVSSGVLRGFALQHAERLKPEMECRIRRLLSRAKHVYELCCAYEEKGYALLLPGDRAWPARMDAIGCHAPLFLFAKGNLTLLNARKAAAAGSRDIGPQTMKASLHLGRRLAEEEIVLVTGGARGVDRSVQQGALEADGSAILIPALPAAEMKETPCADAAMKEGRLLLLCDALPDSPFTPGKALARNHAIYALGEAAVVMAARNGVGGSWRGALDCLKGGWTPVFVPYGERDDLTGCRALEALGARGFDPYGNAPLADVLFAERQMNLFDCMAQQHEP